MSTDRNCTRIALSPDVRMARLTVPWLLECPELQDPPIYKHNRLKVLIGGEEGFAHIAQDLRRARRSIDIACWGFDPAMELEREPVRAQWPRGATWGQLLREAAARGVQVRLLVWHDQAARLAGSLRGYDTRGMVLSQSGGLREGGSTNPSPEQLLRQAREGFNAEWWQALSRGLAPNMALRKRGHTVEAAVSGWKQAPGAANLDKAERRTLEWFSSHHQKTILIDFEPPPADAADIGNPCAYVMGLNSVTDYWDTTEHRFHDPRRGEGWEGDDDGGPGLRPYQDYACRIEGQLLVSVCHNFDKAWNAASKGTGAGEDLHRKIDFDAPSRHLTDPARDAAQQRAQIVRTAPDNEAGEHTIAKLYTHAASFANHYIYLENQYFQYAPWLHEVKRLRRLFMEGCARGSSALEQTPVLHMIVVIPMPERAEMVPRTLDALAELGLGSSMPDQSTMMDKELRSFHVGGSRQPPEVSPGKPPPDMSPLAADYLAAGGGRPESEQREELMAQYSMRSLAVSLWTEDAQWSEHRFPVFAQADREQRRHEQARAAWRQAQEDGSADANGTPPPEPPSREAAKNKAREKRYREIYIHSKLMIIDDSMFTLGSANLNIRSFYSDSEINVACDDAWQSRSLRERVWMLHSKGRFGDKRATAPQEMAEMFKKWSDEAIENLKSRLLGEPITSFVVGFLDKRTSRIRFA